MRNSPDALPPSPLRRRLTLLRNPVSSPLSLAETEEKSEPESPRLRKKDRSSSWLSQISNKSQESATDSSLRGKPARLWIPSRNSVLALSRSYEDRSEPVLSGTSSPTNSLGLGDSIVLEIGHVIHHGEVYTTSGFLKRLSKEYMVLTDRCLLRFKSYERAATALRHLPPFLKQHNRHNSSPSVFTTSSSSESFSPIAPASIHGDKITKIDLDRIVAVNNRRDTGNSFAFDVYWLAGDELRSLTASSKDPRSVHSWLRHLSQHTRNPTVARPTWIVRQFVERPSLRDYVGDVLDQENTSVFLALQHSPSSSSSDEYQVGLNLVIIESLQFHLIPVDTKRGEKKATYGIVNFTSIDVSEEDDDLTLTIRPPFQTGQTLRLTSAHSHDIARCLRRQVQHIRAAWLADPCNFFAPFKSTEDLIAATVHLDDRLETFRSTLSAYLTGYEQNPWRIDHQITQSGEDMYEFRLYPPAVGDYNQLELLAVMRSLYHINIFETISFAGVRLDSLRLTVDPHGVEHTESISFFLQRSRDRSISFTDCNLLVQEICGIATTNRNLRHMDFSDCLSPSDGRYVFDCAVLQAIYPLCRQELTNVEWLSLSGIKLSSIDVDFLFLLADERKAHLRGLNLSRTGLNQQQVTQLLNALVSQENTLEMLDLSDNGPCLNQCSFDSQISRLPYLSVLNLSNLKLSPEIKEPLISSQTLVAWRMRELRFDNSFVNTATIGALADYLQSPASFTMRELSLENSGITGRDIATLLQAVSAGDQHPREIHLAVGENAMSHEHDLVTAALRNDMNPSSLSLDRTDYQDQSQLCDLLTALKMNDSLQYLSFRGIRALTFPDLSLTTLGAIEGCFADAGNLQNVRLAGAALDIAYADNELSLGIRHALMGLSRRTNLISLDVSGLKLHHTGAVLLSEIIANNPHLRDLNCANTNIPLTGFDAILFAIKGNTSLLNMSDMEDCKLADLEDVGGIGSRTQLGSAPSRARKVFSGVEGRLSGRKLQRRKGKRPSTGAEGARPSASHGDTAVALAWEKRQVLLQGYLDRNVRIATGESPAHEGHLDAPSEGDDVADGSLGIKDARMDSGNGSSFTAGVDGNTDPDARHEERRPLLGDSIDAITTEMDMQLAIGGTGANEPAEELSDDEAEGLFIKR